MLSLILTYHKSIFIFITHAEFTLCMFVCAPCVLLIRKIYNLSSSFHLNIKIIRLKLQILNTQREWILITLAISNNSSIHRFSKFQVISLTEFCKEKDPMCLQRFDKVLSFLCIFCFISNLLTKNMTNTALSSAID